MILSKEETPGNSSKVTKKLEMFRKMFGAVSSLLGRPQPRKSVQTLIDCYGQPDEDYIIKFLTCNNIGNFIETKLE